MMNRKGTTMKTMKFAAAGLAAAMLLPLGACGSASDANTLTIWVEKVFSEKSNEEMKQRIEIFSKETGIKVNYEFISATDYMTKLNATIEAGRGIPDITTSAVSKVVNYYPGNPYMDMTDIVERINKDRPYLKSVYEGSKIDGKLYFAPFRSSSTMMFIRMDKLYEAGIYEAPTTWDELFEVAEKISDPAQGFYGLGWGCGSTDEDGDNIFRNIMWNQGGYMFDKDGNVTIDNKVSRKLMQQYKTMYQNKVIPPSASTWDSGGNNTSYLMGESGIIFNAPTLYYSMASDPSYETLLGNTAVVNLPKGEDNDVKMSFVTGLSIMKASKNVDAATKLVEYLLDKDWYDGFLEETAPVFAPVFQDSEQVDVWQKDVNAEVLNYVKTSEGYYGYPARSTADRAVAAKNMFTYPEAKMLNQIVTVNTSIDDALKDNIRKIDELKSLFTEQ